MLGKDRVIIIHMQLLDSRTTHVQVMRHESLSPLDMKPHLQDQAAPSYQSAATAAHVTIPGICVGPSIWSPSFAATQEPVKTLDQSTDTCKLCFASNSITSDVFEHTVCGPAAATVHAVGYILVVKVAQSFPRASFLMQAAQIICPSRHTATALQKPKPPRT